MANAKPFPKWTNAQLAALAPIFEALRQHNACGGVACVIAQIYPDGMIAGLIKDAQCHAVQEALGGKSKSESASLSEWMRGGAKVN